MLDWSESLDGPRSLITGQNVALVTLEDPGVIELRGRPKDRAFAKGVREITGSSLSSVPWSGASEGDVGLFWRGPDRWWLMTARERVTPLLAELDARMGKRAIASDLTGSLAALRLVGNGAAECLARTCPLDLRQIGPWQMRGTTLAHLPVTLLREAESVPAWLVLCPRSYALALATELANAIRTTASLDLFGSRVPLV
jgi:heterotetrameric sarcosine oxidase gamma subunit